MNNQRHVIAFVLLSLVLPSVLGLSACNPATPVDRGSGAAESISTAVPEPDAKRLVDLQTLAAAIAEYQAARGELPVDFPALVETGILAEVPSDPAGRDYEYTILGDYDYELCARFERNSSGQQAGDFWHHRSGHQCFRLNPVFGQY